MPTQNTHLWHKDFFRWLFLRNSRHSKSSENCFEVTLLEETLTFLREISICKGIGIQNSVPVMVKCAEGSSNRTGTLCFLMSNLK